MDAYFFKRIIRRPWFSIVSLIIAGTLCFLICSLSGYRQEQQAELEAKQKELLQAFESSLDKDNMTKKKTFAEKLKDLFS